MANGPFYDAVLARAKVHLEMIGNVSREQTRVWVDALKATLAHHEQREGRLNG